MFNLRKRGLEIQRGFSLIELMIAMTVTLLLLGVVAGVLAGIQKEYKYQRPRMEAVQNANMAMDTIVRLIRMAGTKPPQCSSLTFQGLTPSQPDGSGNYSKLRVQSDWNPADCALTGTEEDVTFSVSGGYLYEDSLSLNPFVDKINALRFKFYSSTNLLIADPVTNSSQISFVQIEIDTIPVNGNSSTIKSAVQVRSR
jgi:prepilin-type N-terminal cleavage/methylation domain-containing protein